MNVSPQAVGSVMTLTACILTVLTTRTYPVGQTWFSLVLWIYLAHPFGKELVERIWMNFRSVAFKQTNQISSCAAVGTTCGWLPAMLFKVCFSQEVNVPPSPNILTHDKCHRTALLRQCPCWQQPPFTAVSCLFLLLGLLLWFFREPCGIVHYQINC